MRFHLMIIVTRLQNKLIDNKDIEKVQLIKQTSQGTNQFYRQEELAILNIFQEHFDNANLKKTEYNPIEANITIFLIYCYSKILNTHYTDIESVMKQLIYRSTREPIELDNGQKISPKNRYALKPKYKKRLEELQIVHDEFRSLSLYII